MKASKLNNYFNNLECSMMANKKLSDNILWALSEEGKETVKLLLSQGVDQDLAIEIAELHLGDQMYDLEVEDD